MEALRKPTVNLAESSPNDIWDSVDRLVDRAPSLEALYWHRLQLLAARRRRASGRVAGDELAEAERTAALRVLSAPALLERVRDAVDGSIVVMKGPEIGARYRDPTERPFKDLDILVEDAPTAHRALLAAGFVEVGDPSIYVGIHHLRPVSLPGLPLLPVEVHHEPKWPAGLRPPATTELLASAIPSSTGVEGIDTLAPEDHALVVAAHSWAHLPLRRIQELLDAALLAEEADLRELEARARAWDFERVWQTTSGSIDSLFYGRSRGSADRLFARHLNGARERTVFESHVERWVSPFWAFPPTQAMRAMASTARAELGPAEGEGWRDKFVRTGKALRNASAPRTQHERQLGAEAHRRRRSR